MLIKQWVVFVVYLLVGISTLYAKSASSPILLPNLELSLLHQAKLVGPIEPEKEITFTIWLKLRNKTQLDQLINELYSPQSSHYQKFLTHEQFNADYGPSKKAKVAIKNYFTQHGMKAENDYSRVRITGKAEQIEHVFKIKINNYRYHNKMVYGNATAPTIAPEIAPYISGVSNLSNIPYARPQYRQMKPVRSNHDNWKPEALNLVWSSFLPTASPTTKSLQGITGAELRIAYNIADIPPISGTTIDGTGQTIVIVDGCGNASVSDILTYSNQYNTANNLPLLNGSNFTVVNHHGNPYTGPCSSPSGWDGEIMLDVQASHTIAPGAKIVLVLTNDVDNTQVADTLDYITTHNFTIGGFSNAYVVSNSWDNTYDELNEPLDATLEAVAALGLSINFAAGDCGDQTYNSSWTCTQLSTTPSIQYPVSSPYVTAVSGTSLFVDNNWHYAFETGWGTLVNGSFYSGSMGGISQYRPSPVWQSSISDFTAGGYNAGTVGYYNHRAIPDIAMLGDLYTGLLTYSDGCSPCYDGGASLATPLFSGTLTLVNQSRALLAGTQQPIGLAAPYFYTNNLNLLQAQALHLITPPHKIVSGAQPVIGGPLSAFKLNDTFFSQEITFNWDSSLTIIEDQFWNDVVGVGSPNIPNFVSTMATL